MTLETEISRLKRCISMAMGCIDPESRNPDERLAWLRLHDALAGKEPREPPCPRPFNTDPEGLTAGQCIELGHCGCVYGVDHDEQEIYLAAEAIRANNTIAPELAFDVAIDAIQAINKYRNRQYKK